MGFWATWSSRRYSPLQQGRWTRWPLQVSSNPRHSMILSSFSLAPSYWWPRHQMGEDMHKIRLRRTTTSGYKAPSQRKKKATYVLVGSLWAACKTFKVLRFGTFHILTFLTEIWRPVKWKGWNCLLCWLSQAKIRRLHHIKASPLQLSCSVERLLCVLLC